MKMDALPLLSDTPPDRRMDVFIAKLKFCENTFDFSNPRAQFLLKETKRRHLVDLARYISNDHKALIDATYSPFMKMVAANLLRSLPLGNISDMSFDAEDDEPFLEPSWPHLHMVYDMLRRFVLSNDMDSPAARASISIEFVLGLIELFNSEDPRERDYLKTILHRIYGKVMGLRPVIRRAIVNVFSRVTYQNDRFNGVGELLEILGAIIHGFAVPLKEEHRELLRRGLLPLHLPNCLPNYHAQLVFTLSQFIVKDRQLVNEMVLFMLRHWPARHTRKEVMLLGEIEELLEFGDVDEEGELLPELFRRMGRCIESPHFQVAERALYFWGGPYASTMLMRHCDILMPAIVGPLLNNVNAHWNANVLALSRGVIRTVESVDRVLFSVCKEAHERELQAERARAEERSKRWHIVEQLALQRGKDRTSVLENVVDGSSSVEDEDGADGFVDV